MRLGVKCSKRKARPRRLGLMLPTIKCASPSKITIKCDGSLASEDTIEGEAERMGMVVMH